MNVIHHSWLAGSIHNKIIAMNKITKIIAGKIINIILHFRQYNFSKISCKAQNYCYELSASLMVCCALNKIIAIDKITKLLLETSINFF